MLAIPFIFFKAQMTRPTIMMMNIKKRNIDLFCCGRGGNVASDSELDSRRFDCARALPMTVMCVQIKKDAHITASSIETFRLFHHHHRTYFSFLLFYYFKMNSKFFASVISRPRFSNLNDFTKTRGGGKQTKTYQSISSEKHFSLSLSLCRRSIVVAVCVRIFWQKHSRQFFWFYCISFLLLLAHYPGSFFFLPNWNWTLKERENKKELMPDEIAERESTSSCFLRLSFSFSHFWDLEREYHFDAFHSSLFHRFSVLFFYFFLLFLLLLWGGCVDV